MRGGMDAGVHRPASGPFIGRTFTYAPATRTDVVATSAVFVLCMGLAFFATKTGLKQTKWSRRPWKSLYFRLLWLTLAVTVSHAILFLLCMLDIVRLSVYSLLLIRKLPTHIWMWSDWTFSHRLVSPSTVAITNHRKSDSDCNVR